MNIIRIADMVTTTGGLRGTVTGKAGDTLSLFTPEGETINVATDSVATINHPVRQN